MQMNAQTFLCILGMHTTAVMAPTAQSTTNRTSLPQGRQIYSGKTLLCISGETSLANEKN